MAGLKKLAYTLRFGNTRTTNHSAGSTGNEERLIKPRKLAKFRKETSNLQQHEDNFIRPSVAQLSSTQAQVSTQDDEDQVSIRTVSSYSIDEDIRELAALSRRYESIQTHPEASARNTEDQAPIHSCLWNSSYVRLRDLPASTDRDEALPARSRPSRPGGSKSVSKFGLRRASDQQELSSLEASSSSVTPKRPLVSSSFAPRRRTRGKIPERKCGFEDPEEPSSAPSAAALLGNDLSPTKGIPVVPTDVVEPFYEGSRPMTPSSSESRSSYATAESGRWQLPEQQQSAASHCGSRNQAAPSKTNGKRAISEAAPGKAAPTFLANDSSTNALADTGEPNHRWKGKYPVIDQPEGHSGEFISLRHLLARAASIERVIESQLLSEADPSLHLREMHARIRLFQESALRLQREQDERKRARLRDCVVCGDTKDPLDFPNDAPTPGCRHPSRLCAQCLQSWVASELDSKGCEGIKCPECPQILQYADVRQAASQETFKAYDNLATRNALSTLADFAWCLNAQCGSGQLNIQNQNFMECASCRFKQCLRHKGSWHTGETCEQYEYRSSGAKARADEAKTEATLKTMSKLCPNKKCGWRIEKIGGCEHMTCRRCRHEFCWQCMAAQSEIKRIGNEAHKTWCKFHSRNLETAWPFNVH
ncbi:hypothetical protein D0861_07120 [Hortaea werneckii]|uniref:RBR-type E3 ubiquitin transferase n=1 Tax=Hortaea werneckii TaxID=91943 RepID=A0A3M7F5P0_HORWE|nr:hypothetical protein D0861_07120 [Hortaea werneckii]